MSLDDPDLTAGFTGDGGSDNVICKAEGGGFKAGGADEDRIGFASVLF